MRKKMDVILLGDPSKGGFRGYNSCGSNNDLAYGQSPLCYNYLVSTTGLKKRGGSAKDNATEVSSGTGITGLHRHYNGTAYKTFAKVGTDVYDVKSTGASASVLGSLTASDEVEFASWAGYFFLCNGANLYNGTTSTASAVTWLDEDGASTSGWTLKPTPKVLVLHKEHLWWIDKNSTRVGFTVRDYYDRVFEDPIDADNYGSWVDCDANDGEYLTALVRMPVSDALMAFKSGKSYFIEGDYDDTNNTLVVRAGVPTGTYSQKAVAVCPDGYIRWYGAEGIWQYRQDVGATCISRNDQLQLDIEAELSNIASTNRTLAAMGYWKHYLLFAYPYGSSATYNNRVLAFDTIKMEWMPIRSWNVARFCLFEDETVHAGWANAGYVKKLFYGTNDDSAAIACYYDTKYYGSPQTEAVLDSLRGRILEGRSFNFAWQSDPGSSVSGSIVFSYGTSPTVLANRDSKTGTQFTLGNRTSLGSGTSLADRDSRVLADFKRRLPAGQKFREMKFTFSESSTSAHEIDFVEARVFPRRVVI